MYLQPIYTGGWLFCVAHFHHYIINTVMHSSVPIIIIIGLWSRVHEVQFGAAQKS